MTINILLAEDTESQRTQYGKFLESLGHKVLYAKNGVMAQTAIKRYSRDELEIDVVITDVQMPKASGLHVTATVADLSEPLPTLVHSSEPTFLGDTIAKVITGCEWNFAKFHIKNRTGDMQYIADFLEKCLADAQPVNQPT